MIKPGDLVICVRSCCGEGVGKIFRVAVVEPARLYHRCGLHMKEEAMAASYDGSLFAESWFDLRWLKRIDPLDEKELRDEVMELTA